MLYCPAVPTVTRGHAAALTRLAHAMSDGTRTGILLALRDAPGYPSELAAALGVSRQTMSNQLACLRGCGLVVAEPEGRRTRYRLADDQFGSVFAALLGLALAVDPSCCTPDGCGCR